MRAAAVLVDVGFKLAHRTNQALSQLLGQGCMLGSLLSLPAELQPLHRFVLFGVAAGQDGSEPPLVVAKVSACLATTGQH